MKVLVTYNKDFKGFVETNTTHITLKMCLDALGIDPDEEQCGEPLYDYGLFEFRYVDDNYVYDPIVECMDIINEDVCFV